MTNSRYISYVSINNICLPLIINDELDEFKEIFNRVFHEDLYFDIVQDYEGDNINIDISNIFNDDENIMSYFKEETIKEFNLNSFLLNNEYIKDDDKKIAHISIIKIDESIDSDFLYIRVVNNEFDSVFSIESNFKFRKSMKIYYSDPSNKLHNMSNKDFIKNIEENDFDKYVNYSVLSNDESFNFFYNKLYKLNDTEDELEEEDDELEEEDEQIKLFRDDVSLLIIYDKSIVVKNKFNKIISESDRSEFNDFYINKLISTCKNMKQITIKSNFKLNILPKNIKTIVIYSFHDNLDPSLNFTYVDKIRCDTLDLKNFNSFNFNGKIFIMKNILYSDLLIDKFLLFNSYIYKNGFDENNEKISLLEFIAKISTGNMIRD